MKVFLSCPIYYEDVYLFHLDDFLVLGHHDIFRFDLPMSLRTWKA